ncbi:PorT family protein [Dysgonomonas sp. 216]|uniref:outer membrane beta-barrel protein n=1 Tax=Dysgonomonas sp. 216 TaxID=2302934 RepID=UPI0013D7F608|nr:outer membrane beta-barrel protein [Dysgonomonas sp. 216]NDW17884.1 PorT family protein [Dysgonomonas sp. 216]
MMQDKDNIKNIFSSKFKNFESDVPDSVWSKIEASLSTANVVPIASKKTLYRRLTMVSGVAAALIIGFLFILNDQPEKQASDFIASQEKHSFTDIEKQIQRNINNEVSITEKSNQYAYISTIRQTGVQQPVIETNIAVETHSNDEVHSIDVKSTITNSKPYTESELRDKIRLMERHASGEYVEMGQPIAKLQKSENKGFGISVGGHSGLSRSASEIAANPSLRVSTEEYDVPSNSSPFYNPMSPETTLTNGLPLYDKDKVNIDHKQPISIGLRVSKLLSKNLSLETGLVYTYLSSDIKSAETASSDYPKTGSQSFYYLGVPISLNYEFVQWGKARFYVSAGGMMQKDFYGKLDLRESYDGLMNTDYSVINEKVSQDHIQFSVTTSVGVSYPVYKKLHVYSNIGGAYYFDAKNEYRTIYTDRKTQLDLNVGFKYEF